MSTSVCRKRLLVYATVFFCITLCSSCTQVRFNEKQKHADRIMQFDYDPLASDIQNHVTTSREASIGGFSSAGAGGCGCN